MAKPKQIFSYLDGRVRILRDGSQFILAEGPEDNEKRGYFTTIGSIFKRIIDDHIGQLTEGELNDIKEMRKLMKRAWGECSRLAESIKDEAALVMKTKPS